MSYTISKLPDLPVVLHTLHEDHSLKKESIPIAQEIIKLLNNQPEKVFLMVDMLRFSVGLDDLIYGANVAGRQLEMFKHPKIIEVLVITTNAMVELSAKGMNSPIFGNARIKTFKTQEDGLEYVRNYHG